MRKLMMALSVAAGMMCSAQTFEDAFTAVANMGPGWNLGNTLDCHSSDPNNMWIEILPTGLNSDNSTDVDPNNPAIDPNE